MEDESLPLVVLWVCQWSSKRSVPASVVEVRWNIAPRRVAVATGCGKCQGFKGVEKTRSARSQTVHRGGQYL